MSVNEESLYWEIDTLRVERDRLKAENERLKARKFHCLSCDGELIAPPNYAEWMVRAQKAEAENERLKRECESLKAGNEALWAMENEVAKSAHARAEKAEAELERARPLLQECLDQFTAFFDAAWHTVYLDPERPLNNIEKKLRAALAAKKEEK